MHCSFFNLPTTTVALDRVSKECDLEQEEENNLTAGSNQKRIAILHRK